MTLFVLTAVLSLLMSQRRGAEGPPPRDTMKTVREFVVRWIDTAKVGPDYDPVWNDLCSLAIDVPDSVRSKISQTRHPGGKEGGKIVLATDDSGFVTKANYLDRRRTESTNVDRSAAFAGLRLRPAFRKVELTGQIAWEERGVLRRLELNSVRERSTAPEIPLQTSGRIQITNSTLDSLDSAVVKTLRAVMDSVYAVRLRGQPSKWFGFPSPHLEFQFGPDGKLVHLRLEEYFPVLKPYPLWMLAAMRGISHPATGRFSPVYTLDYLTAGLKQIHSASPMLMIR